MRARFPNEWPNIGTLVVVCRESCGCRGEFISGIVTNVQPYKRREATSVVYDDGRKDAFSLKRFNVQICPVDELCDEHAEATITNHKCWTLRTL